LFIFALLALLSHSVLANYANRSASYVWHWVTA